MRLLPQTGLRQTSRSRPRSGMQRRESPRASVRLHGHIPMNGRVDGRKRGPLGSDPGDAHGSALDTTRYDRLHGRIPRCGSLLHVAPIPVPRSGAPSLACGGRAWDGGWRFCGYELRFFVSSINDGHRARRQFHGGAGRSSCHRSIPGYTLLYGLPQPHDTLKTIRTGIANATPKPRPGQRTHGRSFNEPPAFRAALDF